MADAVVEVQPAAQNAARGLLEGHARRVIQMTVTLDQYEQAELFHWIGFRHAQADIHARQAHIEARAREATRI